MSRFTRFSYLILVGILLTSILVGCGSGQTPTSAPTTAASTQVTNQTDVTVSPTLEATSSTIETPAIGDTPVANGEDATPRIVTAANAFLGTLSDTQKDAVL